MKWLIHRFVRFIAHWHRGHSIIRYVSYLPAHELADPALMSYCYKCDLYFME